MFTRNSSGIPTAGDDLVPLLFGEFSLDQVAKLSFFDHALDAEKHNDKTRAIAEYRKLAGLPESRIQYCAWSALRKLGVDPEPEIARTVLGVVIEYGMPEGTDYLAVYHDNSARYINYSGKILVLEPSDNGINADLKRLLQYSQAVADLIGVWQEPRRPAPAAGVVRMSFLTPAGLLFGEGPVQAMSSDSCGRKILQQGALVLNRLCSAAIPQGG